MIFSPTKQRRVSGAQSRARKCNPYQCTVLSRRNSCRLRKRKYNKSIKGQIFPHKFCSINSKSTMTNFAPIYTTSSPKLLQIKGPHRRIAPSIVENPTQRGLVITLKHFVKGLIYCLHNIIYVILRVQTQLLVDMPSFLSAIDDR